MEQRRLGRTEHRSSVAVLGAAAFWGCTAEEAEAGFHLALSRGVNHLDIAPSYGHAEVVVGPHVTARVDTGQYNQYSILAAIEARFGLTKLNGAASVTPLPLS